MKKIVLILNFFVFFVHAASFDCKKATTAIEKDICSDANLSALDEALAKVYKKVLALSIQNRLSKYEGSSNYNFFKQTQKKWLKARNRNCGKYRGDERKECLLSYYTARIEKLKEFDDGAMVYRNFKHLLFLYTHRPYIAENFKPYLDKASYEKLKKELLDWEKSYEVCRNRFGVLDENCTKKVAKEKWAYYNALLQKYKNHRTLNVNDTETSLERTHISFEEEEKCFIYDFYKKSEIQKLCKNEPEFEELEFTVPKDPKPCSRDTHRMFEKNDQTISYINKNVVVIKTETSDYTGGLHGDFATDCLNLDRNSGKIIQWSDLFGKRKRVLYSFIVRNVRDLIGLEHVDRLSDDELYDMSASADRMELTDEGIVIRFGLYEISGYADGEPSFLIPLEKLKSVMTPEKFAYYFGNR